MDQQFKRVGFDVRMVRLQPWKLWLLAVMGGALALALAVAVAGLFLILVPLFLVGGLLARLLLRGSAAPVTRRPSGAPEVIEGRYEVLDLRQDRRPH
jgi:hypothetical protein